MSGTKAKGIHTLAVAVSGWWCRIAGLSPRAHVLILMAITVLSWGILVVPLREDLSVLYRYWDGPMYVMVAKTLYRIPVENPITEVYTWPPKVFAPFLLAYPLAIRAVAPLLGYAWGMITLTVLTSAVAVALFYWVLVDLELTDHPLALSIWFLFVPYRWLVYRSVGATEPLFLVFTILSLHMFVRRRYAWSFAAAALACVTRIQGVLLVPTFLLLVFFDRQHSPLRGLLLLCGVAAIPSLLIGNLWVHARVYGDPLAYLSVNNEMVHFSPFWRLLDLASFSNVMVGGMGSQLLLLLYAITVVGLVKLWRIDRSKVLFVYCFFGTLFLAFVSDEDLARFLIPFAPFTWVLGLQELWNDRRMAWAFAILVPLTYAYTWQLLPSNTIIPEVMRDLLAWSP